MQTRRRVAFLVPALAGGLSLTLGACSPSPFDQAQRTIADGEAARQVQKILDRNPQCADLLGGLSPIEGHAGDAALPTVQALMAAGLVAREPSSASAPGRVIYQPTAAARPYIQVAHLGGVDNIKLCYARRRVSRVWLRPHGKTEPLPELSYAFRLIDPAPWSQNPLMKKAFPFLQRAFTKEYVASDFVSYQKGAWVADFIAPALPSGGEKEAFWFGVPERGRG